MRLGRGKLVFRRTSLVSFLRAGESRLSEKKRSGFELRSGRASLLVTEFTFICGMYGESHTHEQEAERTANDCMA